MRTKIEIIIFIFLSNNVRYLIQRTCVINLSSYLNPCERNNGDS
jgi:hypothetical protein